MVADNVPLALRVIRLLFRSLGALLPQRAGKVAYEMWFSPTRFNTPTREQAVRHNARISQLDVFGQAVTTYEWTPAQHADRTVLFIHGWSGRATQVHAFVQPLIDAGVRVVAFDGPAHGDSPGAQTSVLQFTDALLELQQHYGAFDGVITHSFGGMVLGFASQHGFTPGRAVCICPPENLEVLLDNFSTALSLPGPVREAMLQRLRMSHGHVMRDLIDTAINATQLDYPGLLIHDRDDEEVPWQGSERIAAAWQDCELMLTDGLKHHRILRDDKVVKTGVAFLLAG